MYDKSSAAWFRVGMNAWALGIEASLVIGLRMAKMAAGGSAASQEAGLMVAEKIKAGLELQAKLAAAPFGMAPLTSTRKALHHYRDKVASNRRRLSR